MPGARVNSSHLSEYRGKTVRLVGKVLQIHGTQAIVEACDEGQVTVHLSPAGVLSPGATVEVIGKVDDDLSVVEMTSVSFSDVYDRAAYNKMVLLAKEHPDTFTW
ncbi:hypothetical protein HK104_011447 [Borealophlyctis nickersoniae]|nr:hypothetical protein HK104_011447 [Borealophlyctis nickersoniae]